MLEWLWPWVFAVAPLPWLIHRFSKGESLQPSALRAPFAARWRGLAGAGRSIRSGRGYWWLLWLTWMMLIVATARPQWIGEPIELPNTGRDLMLGLDLSGSMQIEDMQVGNRLVPRITAVKAIAAELVLIGRNFHRLAAGHVAQQIDDVDQVVPQGRSKFVRTLRKLFVKGSSRQRHRAFGRN